MQSIINLVSVSLNSRIYLLLYHRNTHIILHSIDCRQNIFASKYAKVKLIITKSTRKNAIMPKIDQSLGARR